ncbi:hypothetical protein J7L09_00220 [bacterium]|nr:hypothetical protein [bacterium]
MRILKKLQSLPLQTRKRILWTVTGILGILFFSIWIISAKNAISNFNLQQQQVIPPFPKIDMPSIPIPTFTPEEIQKVQEELEKQNISFPTLTPTTSPEFKEELNQP